MKKVLIIAFIIFMVQGTAQECREEIKQVYTSFLNELKDSKNYKLVFSQTNVVQGKKLVQNYSIYKGKEKSYLFCDDYDVLREKEFTVSILKNEQLIYLSDNQDDPNKKMNQFTRLKDHFFDHSKEISCNSTKDGTQIIELVSNQENAEFSKVIIEYSVEENKILNYTIFLGNEDSEQLVFLEIESFEKNQVFPALQKNPKDYVFASKNEILDHYKNYSLIDLTKKID